MGVELKDKIMSNYSREVERQQSITAGIRFCVYSVLGQSPLMCHNGVVGNMAKFQSSHPVSFPWQGEYDSLFIVFSLLGGYRMLHFISVVLSGLVVGRLVMVAWGRRSY